MSREFTERQAILNLQRYLRQLSFFDPRLPELPLDGIFESETREAVEIFQQNNELPVTGEADRETWDHIYQSYLESLTQHAKPVPMDIFFREPEYEVIRRGTVGFPVAAVQYMLNEVLVFCSEYPIIADNGNFDEQTENAVKLFQEYTFLPLTGEVDLQTWNRLTSFYNEHARHSNQ